MRRFNTTGTCFADRHYMVNIDERVQQIKKMVDLGDYFCINRGRQYGKTTTLHYLKKALDEEYTVFSISFEVTSDNSFANVMSVGRKVLKMFMRTAKYGETKDVPHEAVEFLQNDFPFETSTDGEDELSDAISAFCSLCKKPVVVIIDEVDQAGTTRRSSSSSACSEASS